MSKLGLQTLNDGNTDKNIATLTADGTASNYRAEYGRLNFVDKSHDGWLSVSLGKNNF